jgi:hypothetical protein
MQWGVRLEHPLQLQVAAQVVRVVTLDTLPNRFCYGVTEGTL